MMLFPSKYGRKMLRVSAAFFLLSANSAFAVQDQELLDPVKRSTDRAEFFLLRTYDELSKNLEYEKAAHESLDRRPSDSLRRQLPDWHKNTATWLEERLREAESDLEVFYTAPARKAVMNNRYAVMTSEYARLGEQLDKLAARLDEANEKNAAEIRKRRNIIEYYEYRAEETERRKQTGEKRMPYRLPPDDWVLYYRDMDRETVVKLETEITDLEDARREIGLLRDLEQYETGWIRLKAEDSKALDALAEALLSGSLDRIEKATNDMIRQYEADSLLIHKLLHGFDEKRPRMVNSDPGSIRALDRNTAFSDYAFTVKTRWEHHLQWLREMIGAYRADIVLLEKERKRR